MTSCLICKEKQTGLKGFFKDWTINISCSPLLKLKHILCISFIWTFILWSVFRPSFPEVWFTTFRTKLVQAHYLYLNHSSTFSFITIIVRHVLKGQFVNHDRIQQLHYFFSYHPHQNDLHLEQLILFRRNGRQNIPL